MSYINIIVIINIISVIVYIFYSILYTTLLYKKLRSGMSSNINRQESITNKNS